MIGGVIAGVIAGGMIITLIVVPVVVYTVKRPGWSPVYCQTLHFTSKFYMRKLVEFST